MLDRLAEEMDRLGKTIADLETTLEGLAPTHVLYAELLADLQTAKKHFDNAKEAFTSAQEAIANIQL